MKKVVFTIATLAVIGLSNKASAQYTKLLDFAGTANGGQPEYTNLIQATDGMLYGMTSRGGANGLGVLFQYNPATNVYTDKIDFHGGTNGAIPKGSLFAATDGMLYGMTEQGGANGWGVLFQYNPTTNTLTNKLDFAGATNGKYPEGSLCVASTGMLYGMTSQGGANGWGVLFQYNFTTNTYTKKLDFAGNSNGSFPNGSLFAALNGVLCGMTSQGGANSSGVLFEYDLSASTYTDRFNFGTANGTNPNGSLMQASDGMLYGMTYSGGANNFGVLFQYDRSTSTYTKKLDFAGTNGSYPYGDLMQASDGMLYGMTHSGGTNNLGVLFQFNPATSTYTKKLDFADLSNGKYPESSLMQASDGLLYGMTYNGGANNQGVLFKFCVVPISFSQTLTKCAGQSVTVGSNTYTTTGTYTDVLTSYHGCDSTVTTHLTVNPLPSVTANASPSTTVCIGTSITLTGGGATTYAWTGGVTDGVAFAPTTTNTYTVTGTDGNGCVNTATKHIIVNPLPVVTASASANNFCTGSGGVVLTGGGANTYTWTGGVTDGVAFAPTVSNTYTVTGTDGNGCTNKATKTIIVSNPPTVYANATATSLCRGDSVTLTGSGANTYTWTNSVIDGVAFAPTNTNTYHVTGTDANGCTNTNSIAITVNASPTVSIGATATVVCYGTSVTLTQGGTAVSWAWSDGVVSGSAFVPTATATYSLSGTSSIGCTKTVTKTITVNPLPTVSAAASPTLICAGSTATLTASGTATTYSWSTSATTAATTVAPSVTTTYTVTGTDGNGCKNTATTTVSIPANLAPDICVVSTDSATNYNYNIIYWDKTLYTNADSFIVYRYGTSSYLVIGRVSKDSLSMFVDANRNIGGPNGGDPNSTGWQYTLAIKDNCGTISPMSPYHFTSNFQQNNQNLSWTAYIIQSPQSNPTNGYQVLRDSLGINDFHVFANTSYLTTSFQDPNYALYPNANYRVDATGFNCTPTLRLSGNNSTDAAKIRSHSNQNNNRHTSGISKLVNSNEVSIYPNPASTSINVTLRQAQGTNASLQITDMLGNTVKQSILYNPTSIINVVDLNEGVYTISISSNVGVVNKRVVIVR